MAIDIEWQVKPRDNDKEESQQRMFPRIAKSEVIDESALVKRIARHSALSSGAAIAIMESFAEVLAELLREGKTVELPSLGTFRPAIGTDAPVTQEATTSAASKVTIRDIKFKPSNALMQRVTTATFRTVPRHATLKVPSVEQIIPALSDYFQSHDSITRTEFAALFHLKRATAYTRLHALVRMGVIREVGHNRKARYVKG